MSKSSAAGRGGEFFTLLEELRAFRAGPLDGDPSDRALARTAGVSPTTIGDWLRGGRFPQEIGKVLVVVRMVRAAAAPDHFLTRSSRGEITVDQIGDRPGRALGGQAPAPRLRLAGLQAQLAHQPADQLSAGLLAAAGQLRVDAPVAVFRVIRLE